MAVHRVELPLRSAKVYSKYRDNPEFKLHLKCPNCYHFKKTTRHADDSGIALVGDPRTTGALDDADAMGYPDHHHGPGQIDAPDDGEDDADAEESADDAESEPSDEEVAEDSDENEASDEAPDGDETDADGADETDDEADNEDDAADGGEETVTDADDGGDDA